MKKQLFTTIRYEGKRLEPGTYEFDKEFVTAHPDVFKPESVSQEVELKTTSLEKEVEELQAELKEANKSLEASQKEAQGLKAQLATAGAK